jgi:hypothetical protein
MPMGLAQATAALRSAAVPLDAGHDGADLPAWIGDAHYVLLGGADRRWHGART